MRVDSHFGRGIVVKHQQLTEEWRELIALYVLGSLPHERATAFEDHLAEGCKTCTREVRRLIATVGTLGYAAAPIPPRPEVRARLLAHIQGISEERGGKACGVLTVKQSPQRDWTIVRATEGIWKVAEVKGVVTKRLSPVMAGPGSVRLARLRGEVRYPLPPHADLAELYMLAGALTVADQVLQAGDYCAAPAGVVPHLTSGAPGCTFLWLASKPETHHEAAAVGGSPPGLVCVRAATRAWRPSGTRGVDLSPLFTDPLRQTMTALVRMAPGARLPRHRHVTDEQFYMLEGDGHVHGQVLQAGDYYQAAAGTVHDITYTEGGCLFLLLASHVEVVP
jgi:quercetin dioxygenase-like cupin family protein